MFTGLVKDVGKIVSIKINNDFYFKISTKFKDLELGASICCSGICLTVIAFADDWFEVCVSPETLAKSTAFIWQVGTHINLEKSLTLKDALGGHLVTGHVDTTALISRIIIDSNCRRYKLTFDDKFRPFIAPKGSVCINGISLTVNDVERDAFWITIIPHTYEHTNLQYLQTDDLVNLEVDLMARYAYNILNFNKEAVDA